MDSCFPPLAILGQRDVPKFSERNSVDTKNRITVEDTLTSTEDHRKNAMLASESAALTKLSLTGKIGILEDLDLYYVRQLARNSKEYDLERKIELEIKMREGSSRLLAAARHPAQTLEAARTLLTSNERMSTYMLELQHRKRDESTAKIRFPLMWRDSDHFKNRGDHRRFAVFCLARIGTEIHDTSLLCPIDREHTDISFPDVLIFNNVPAEFELTLDVYSHVLQEDLSIASTPRRIRRTIHSSISKTVGKKLAASLRDELESEKATGPQFDLVARARMTLDDTDSNVHTHDLVLQSSCENKHQALPLFGHFCCRLAVQPNCINKEVCAGNVNLNGRYRWARLQGFRIEIWESEKSADECQDAIDAIPVNKETSIQWSDSTSNELRITNCIDGTENSTVFKLDSSEDAQRWLKQLVAHANDHSRWKHAAIVQQVPCIESTRNSFIGNERRQGSLYDETPLIESISSDPNSGIKTTGDACVPPDSSFGHFRGVTSGAASRRSRSSSIGGARRKFSGIALKSHWTFSNKSQE